MSNQLPFLRAKVQAIKTVLDKASAKERESRVATRLARRNSTMFSRRSAQRTPTPRRTLRSRSPLLSRCCEGTDFPMSATSN